jgi:hypothetical protein
MCILSGYRLNSWSSTIKIFGLHSHYLLNNAVKFSSTETIGCYSEFIIFAGYSSELATGAFNSGTDLLVIDYMTIAADPNEPDESDFD